MIAPSWTRIDHWIVGLLIVAAALTASETTPQSPSSAGHPAQTTPVPDSALVLTNEWGDSVSLSTRALMRCTMGGLIAITGPRSHVTFKLSDGSTLRVTEQTPAGEFTDINGDPLYVVPGSKYPRYVNATTSITRQLRFVVHGRDVRVGTLMTPTQDEVSPERYLWAIARGIRGYGLSDQDTTAAYELGEDGPTYGDVVLAVDRSFPVKVSWFAYDGDHRGSGTNRETGIRRVGNRYEWRAEWAPASPPVYPLATSDLSGPRIPRLVGAVIVDPVRNVVTEAPR